MSATYAGFKSNLLNDAATIRIYGYPLELQQDTSPRRVALNPCLCTWDSPDSPCPCLHSKIWWVMDSDVLSSGASEKVGHTGDKLNYYNISKNSQIVVESIESSSIERLVRGRKISPEKIARLLFLARMIKSNRASAGASKDDPSLHSGGLEDPWLRELWDGIKDIIHSVDEVVGSFEFSGGDVAVVLEVLGILLL